MKKILAKAIAALLCTATFAYADSVNSRKTNFRFLKIDGVTCLDTSADRIYHDTNCNKVKDVDENFIDVLDHTLLTNIGADSHATIDSHIDLVNEHLDWTTSVGTIHTGNYIEGGAGTDTTAYHVSGTDVAVADGGTGASSHIDGGVLFGSGTGAVTNSGLLSDGQMIVGDGTTDPAVESGATLRTSIGVDPIGTDNSTDVTIESGLNYVTISSQELTLGTVDISDDTNLAVGAPITLTGDTIDITKTAFEDGGTDELEITAGMMATGTSATATTYWAGDNTWDTPVPAADSLTWLEHDFSPTLASNEGMETDECQIVATATGACVLCEGSGKDDDEHQFCFPDIDPTDTTYNMLTSYDYGTPVNVGNAYVATLPGIDFTGADFSVVGTGKACLGGSEAGSFCTVDGDCAGSPAGVCTASKMATISLHANVLKTTSTDVMLESTDNVMDDAKHICLGAGSDGCLESNGTDVDVTGGFDMSAATIQIPSNSTPSVSVVGEIEVDSDDGTLHIYSDAEHKYYPGRGRQVFTTTNWIWGGDTVLTNGNDIYPMVNAIWSGSSANETFSQQLVKAGMVCHDLYVDTPGCTWDGTTVLTAGFRDDASTVLSCTISSGTTCDSGVSTATVVSGSKINFFLQCDGVDCPPDGTYCNPNMNVICDLD